MSIALCIISFYKTKALIMGLDVAKWKRCNSLKQIALEVVEIEFF